MLITIEEGAVGGYGSFVAHHLAWRGLLDGGLKFRPMCLPDVYIDHDNPRKQYDQARLNAQHIVETALQAIGGRVMGAEALALPARA